MQPQPNRCPHCANKYNNTSNLCPKHLRALKLNWYAKLKNRDFEDIEQEDDGLLKTWSTSIYTSRVQGATYAERRVGYEATAEYFRLAGHFLYDYPFASESDRFIWKSHAEGVTIEKTVILVRKSKLKLGKTINKRNIHETIQRLCKHMKTMYLTKKI